MPMHALRVRKSDDLFIEVASHILEEAGVANIDVAALVADVISLSEPAKPAHRALPDARLELERLLLVREAANNIVASSTGLAD